MSATKLLDLLHKVRKTGPGRWVAQCPAHDDKSPSLSIRETDDGKVLLKCWTGCSAHEVVSAVGLNMEDLFPPKGEAHSGRGESRAFPAADVLRCIQREAMIVAVAAGRLGNGHALNDEDRARLLLAASTIQEAMSDFRKR